MLRACRQVLRPGGRLAFLTIQPTPGLDERQRRRANRFGPPATALRTSYPSMLRTAGFVDIAAIDLTADYRATLHRWIDATERRSSVIRDVVGEDVYQERQTSRSRTLQAIDDGLLSRFRYTAAR